MARTVKVNRLAQSGVEVIEVPYEEAERMVEEANTKGRLVANKRTGEVIDKITPGVQEIMIIEIVGGG